MSRRWSWVMFGVLSLIAGCGGGGGGGGAGGAITPPGGSSEPTVLFSDNFSGTFPGTTWTVGTGSQGIDSTVGNAAPSLQVKANKFQPPNSFSGTIHPGLAETTATFGTTGGLTVAVDLAPTLTSSSSASSFSIIDTGGSGFTASVSFEPGNSAVSPAPTPAVTFSIGGTTASFANPASGVFHLYQFKVTSAGAATWTMDGAQKLGATGVAAGTVKLQVMASGFTAEASPTFLGEIHADNVYVTAP